MCLQKWPVTESVMTWGYLHRAASLSTPANSSTLTVAISTFKPVLPLLWWCPCGDWISILSWRARSVQTTRDAGWMRQTLCIHIYSGIQRRWIRSRLINQLEESSPVSLIEKHCWFMLHPMSGAFVLLLKGNVACWNHNLLSTQCRAPTLASWFVFVFLLSFPCLKGEGCVCRLKVTSQRADALHLCHLFLNCCSFKQSSNIVTGQL